MQNTEEIGKRIARRRKICGFTQEELATRLSITPQAVSKWENGTSLPDIALLPMLAEHLGVQIGALFGDEEAKAQDVPDTYEGMPIVCEQAGNACYSDKEVDQISGDIVRFVDGSTANVTLGEVVNRGRGEIRVMSNHSPQMEENLACVENREQCFEGVRGLSLALKTACDVTLKAGDGTCRVSVIGSERFLSGVYATVHGGVLTIRAEDEHNLSSSEKNALIVETGFMRGERLEVSVSSASSVMAEPAFDQVALGIRGSGSIAMKTARELEVSVQGSGDVRCEEADIAHIGIRGSGDVTLGRVSAKLEADISGSGDVQCGEADVALIGIRGSGDVTLGRVNTRLDVDISGSGDINCGASEMDTLEAHIRGSGDLNASSVSVREATLVASGESSMVIGRIRQISRETISEKCKLRVLTRG